jgi:DNA-binding PadR family transcriptional regulator
MTDLTLEQELDWLDERFLKSFARIHYLCMIDRSPLTGYDIIRMIKDQYGIRPSAAAIYPVLAELESEGYIHGSWGEGRSQNKKLYSITGKGKKTLSALRKRILLLVKELTGQKPAT